MKPRQKSLAEFLAEMGFTEQRLKQLTGITITRLRVIYKCGTFTDEEFMRLIKVMTVRQAVCLTHAVQVGNFNQNGTGNEQYNTTINNYIFFIMQRLGIAPMAAPARVLPARPVLVASAQQRLLSQQPGSQVATVGSITLASCVC